MNEEKARDLLCRWLQQLEPQDRAKDRKERGRNIDILLDPDSPDPFMATMELEEMLGKERGSLVEFNNDEADQIINVYGKIQLETVLTFLKKKGLVE